MTEKKKSEEAVLPLDERVKGFNADLIPLLGKWKLGLGAQPMLTDDGRIAARPAMFDDSKPKEEPKVALDAAE